MRTSIFVGVMLVMLAPLSRAADQAKIDEAIRKGADYLTAAALQPVAQTNHGTGQASLAGIALMEAGRKPTDATIQAIARVIRDNALRESQTYQVSLAILFLDRLNKDKTPRDMIDVALIQILGCRLLAGQNPNGGWSYATFAPDKAPIAGPLRPATAGILHPEAAKIYAFVRRGVRFNSTFDSDDNSNTQFALVALWVARRNGVPSDFAFQVLETRFIRTQSPTNHGWSYVTSGTQQVSTPAMTCAGLLGLAVGKATYESLLRGRKTNPDDPDKKENDDPFFRPPPPGQARGEGDGENEEDPDEKPPEVKPIKNARDQTIERGLKALGQIIAGQGGGGGIAAGGERGGVSDLYFLWSLERVAVAFGLETVGDVDWYRWGCDKILPAQAADGSWPSHDGQTVGTSFAVLFLAKSNFVSDLTREIDGKVKDPGGGELRGSKGGPSAIPVTGRPPDPDRPAGGGGPKAANLADVRGPSEADKIAKSLGLKSTDAKFQEKLNIARDTKGGQWTSGLVSAIPNLDPKRAVLARESLADRLTRMTPQTLRKMMTDRDPELRRAACLACAMKDDRTHTLDLIYRVTDVDDSVVRAARAGLKVMTKQDFGPPTGSSDDRKRQALDEWKSWYQLNGP